MAFSPDPFVQAPFNTQNYNRYSYVWNNPLSMVDPGGYYCRGADSTWNNYIQSNMDAASSMNTQMSYAMDGQSALYSAIRQKYTLKDLSSSASFQRKRKGDIQKLEQWLHENPDDPMSTKVVATIVSTISAGALADMTGCLVCNYDNNN